MSKIGYAEIQAAWKIEQENEGLQDMGDLKLSRMVSYLSNVRLALAALDAKERIQADILTQEALNLEYMIEDLLIIRKQKILRSALSGHRPRGDMTLSEEDFYNRVQNALDGHAEFVKDTLAGTPSTKKKKKKKTAKKKESTPVSESDEIDYVYVRFLREIEDQVMGLDERTYGPFKKESVAKLPAANVSHWLRDGTVVRFIPEEDME